MDGESAVRVKEIYRARKRVKVALEAFIDRRTKGDYERLVQEVRLLGMVIIPPEADAAP